MTFQTENECRIVWPGQLIGAATVCTILGIDRSTLTRQVRRGALVPLARLDGDHGAYVFDRTDVEHEAHVRGLAGNS